MRRLSIAIIVLFCSLSSTGCGNPAGPSPDVALSGTWTGTGTSDVLSGFVNITTSLSQAGSSITGTYACTRGTLRCLHSSGVIRGTVKGSSMVGQVTFPDGHGCQTFNGTLAAGMLSGHYECADPLSNDSGNWSMTRR